MFSGIQEEIEKGWTWAARSFGRSRYQMPSGVDQLPMSPSEIVNRRHVAGRLQPESHHFQH